MKRKKPVISIFTTTWGHKSIGKAVENALKGYRVYFNLIEPDAISVKPYNALYVVSPSLFKLPFKMSQLNYVSKIIEKYLSKPYTKKIEELIKRQRPKIVISAYFAFNFNLVKLSNKYDFLLLNIIADPRTFHPLAVFSSAENFVFDENAEKKCLNYGISQNRIIKSGWFVRKEFQGSYNKLRVRRSLSLSPNEFTIAVIGGGEGTISILKILPAFADIKHKVQVVFICGRNKSLYRSLKLFQAMHDLKNGNDVKFVIKGYTENTHKYLQASDLVIGKAGPNLLFETVATQTPFFAISHIAGQEDGNLDIIKKYKLGFVEENPVKAIKLTRKIIKNPKILKRFQKPLQRLSEYNNKSYKILMEYIKEKLNTNSLGS